MLIDLFEFIKDIINELSLLSLKVNPIIKNKDNYLAISFKNKEIKKEIQLSHYGNVNEEEISKKINKLYIRQKQCIKLYLFYVKGPVLFKEILLLEKPI